MLCAEAARLAALEVLCPTAALATNANYPTLARDRVFDSRAVALDDLDRDLNYTPILSLYTTDAAADLRGDIAAADDTAARSTLEIVAELAIAATDDAGAFFADAAPADDWHARIVLSALCAQVRRSLLYAPEGYLFRRFVRTVNRVSEETFALPQLGMRWSRITMRFDLSLPDDVFSDAAGLPKPLSDLAAALPAGSVARGRIEALAGQFAVITRAPLEGIDFTEPDTGDTFTVDTTG